MDIDTIKTYKVARSNMNQQSRFLDRDIQWLEFNRRVLYMAIDERVPLLERVRFLAIFSSNLDEFVMKRAGLYLTKLAFEESGGILHDIDPRFQFEQIKKMISDLLAAQADCFYKKVLPELNDQGVHLLNWNELDEKQVEEANRYFLSHVFPMLTPLAVDPGHPFPFISNLSRSLAVTVSHKDRDEKLFSRIKLPNGLNQLVRLNRKEESTEYHFVRLQDIVKNNLAYLFPNMRIVHSALFRLTRNADIEWDEKASEDLLVSLEEELKQRRFGDVVRLEIEKSTDPWVKQFLLDELDTPDLTLFEVPGELDYQDLNIIADLNLKKHHFPGWDPQVPTVLREETASIFNPIRKGDILVHHPYESFTHSVERFVIDAVSDPKVQAIKMTLYRTGKDSPFIPLLIKAAEQGKQVVCLVELKARFDEARNIEWARTLEDAGVHVVYGVVGFKTHAKSILVIRQENDGLKAYGHIGTGNYNRSTAALYEDYGLFTADPRIVDELVEFFNYLTGRSMKADYKNLLIAPINMKAQFIEKINKETHNAIKGKPSRIFAKCNSLEDKDIINSLYEASEKGVEIDLVVRGFSCLVPGLEEYSKNIRVHSIIGRFLEHSRFYYFQNGKEDPSQGLFFIGSADWMYRNLDRRVELICPIYEQSHKERLWEHMNLMLNDNLQRWEMASDGSYKQRQPKAKNDIGTQQVLMQKALLAHASSNPSPKKKNKKQKK